MVEGCRKEMKGGEVYAVAISCLSFVMPCLEVIGKKKVVESR